MAMSSAEQKLLCLNLDEGHLDSLRAQRRVDTPDEMPDPVAQISLELGSATDVVIWPIGPQQPSHRLTFVPMDGHVEAGPPLTSEGLGKLFDGLFPTGAGIPRTRVSANNASRTQLSGALKQGKGVTLGSPII